MSDIPIQIANGTSPVIVQASDPASFWINVGMFVTTIVLAIIAFLALKASNDSTKKSNELTRDSIAELKESNKITRESLELAKLEQKAKLRPIFRFTTAKGSIQGTGAGQRIRFIGKLANKGEVIARNIVCHIAEVDSYSLDEIVSQKDKIKSVTASVIGTLSPGEESEFQFTREGTNAKDLAMWFEYDFLEIKKEEVIAWVNLVGGSDNLNQAWHVAEDIREAEKRLLDKNKS